MPYLPLDPQDIGRTYEAVIRVNSQSGKGGAAWVILRSLELDLPRALQIEFSKLVQQATEDANRELRPSEVVHLFEESYHLKSNPRFNLIDYNITTDRSQSPAPPEPGKALNTKNLKRRFTGVIEIDNVQHAITGTGTGALSSLAAALATLGIDLDVVDYKEHSIGQDKGGATGLGRDVKAATYINCSAAGSKEKVWGVGIHADVVQASLIAMLSAASSVSLQSNLRITSFILISVTVPCFQLRLPCSLPPHPLKHSHQRGPPGPRAAHRTPRGGYCQRRSRSQG